MPENDTKTGPDAKQEAAKDATFFHFATRILRERGAEVLAEQRALRNRSEASAVRNGEAPFQQEDGHDH